MIYIQVLDLLLMNSDMIYDDIGSYPLPEGISSDWIQSAITSRSQDDQLFEIISSAMEQKVIAGVEVPTYPQFQDMNQQFLKVIDDPACVDAPLLVKESEAKILELEALRDYASKYRSDHGAKFKIRVCVTGPVELYLKEFGSTAYGDVLLSFAKSIDRFVKNSIKQSGDLVVNTISIDEPSIGLNPQIMLDDEDIINALTIAGESAHRHGIDAEIHLHSPLNYKLVCQVPSINVIGVESASNPSYLELIDRTDLLATDTFIRAGIARTDIYGLSAILNEKYNINVWKEPDRLSEVVTGMETPQVIAKRLSRCYDMFGEHIKYVGPDCGLGSWPTQNIAAQLLKNTAAGIDKFRQEH